MAPKYNLIRDIDGTSGPTGEQPLTERFKVEDNSLKYRNDIKRANPSHLAPGENGHIVSDTFFDNLV